MNLSLPTQALYSYSDDDDGIPSDVYGYEDDGNENDDIMLSLMCECHYDNAMYELFCHGVSIDGVAGSGVFCKDRQISSRVPGAQTSERAALYAAVIALSVTRDVKSIRIKTEAKLGPASMKNRDLWWLFEQRLFERRMAGHDDPRWELVAEQDNANARNLAANGVKLTSESIELIVSRDEQQTMKKL